MNHKPCASAATQCCIVFRSKLSSGPGVAGPTALEPDKPNRLEAAACVPAASRQQRSNRERGLCAVVLPRSPSHWTGPGSCLNRRGDARAAIAPASI
jgi:hypothetical protein